MIWANCSLKMDLFLLSYKELSELRMIDEKVPGLRDVVNWLPA